MHSNVFLGRSGFTRNTLTSFCLSGLVFFSAALTTVHAAEILATAQISGVQLSRNNWAYTLTLVNTPASTSDIGMFWFGWAAGEADFLSSEPTAIKTPSDWTGTVDGGGPDDGFSIQFVTFTNPLKPGSSVTFTFDSPDSTNVMAGPATSYPQYPTLMSQAYSGHAASGNQELFVIQLVSSSATTNGLGQVTAQVSGANLNLTWTAGTNVVLQQSSTLAPANWAAVPGTLGTNAFTVTNAPVAGGLFYRLATQ
jgi:hypothetical protein